MPERRSLAARRRTTKVLQFEDGFDENDNSQNDSLTERRQTRILNNSFNGHDEPVQTPRQLVDLYQKTVELATQGKINIKNAFSIPLVERLPQVLNVIALDDKENHNLGPNFVKAGSVIDTSAKIYGFRVDALHTETQKLGGNILNTDLESTTNEEIKEGDGQTDNQNENVDNKQDEFKKVIRRAKTKATTFILTDLSKITLEHEFEFRPLQSPHMCQWRGGIGSDSVYAEMVSSTMYSSSDYAIIDGFTNINEQVEEKNVQTTDILDSANTAIIDLIQLRSTLKSTGTNDHFLGDKTLREFVFNEIPSGSFIDTIHESRIEPIDETFNRSTINHDDIDNNDEVYNHEELISAAIDDLNDDTSHANEVFKNALNDLSNQNPSTIHSNTQNYCSQQTTICPNNHLLSSSFMSSMSFADHMPSLLNSKEGQSEYSFFDAAKLKLFAGPNIWKFTNLIPTSTESTIRTSIVQQKQAPTTPHKLTNMAREGAGVKRNIRIDVFNKMSVDEIMLGNGNSTRDRKTVSTSQSALLLRVREKSLNQMQLARKIRPLTDLTNSHNFPDLNFELFDLMNQQREQRRQQQTEEYYDHNDFDGLDHNHFDDENGLSSALNYDFVRPVHYEKIEFAKGSSSVNAKNLKRQMIEEFARQKVEQQRTLSLDTSTTSQQSSTVSSQTSQPIVEFSILCENLVDHGHLSLETDLASAFYCMLINCNENKLYMKSNVKCDDLFIQDTPFMNQRNLSTLSYSYVSHSNLSILN